MSPTPRTSQADMLHRLPDMQRVQSSLRMDVVKDVEAAARDTVNMSHCTSSTVIAGDKPGKERHTGGFSSDEGEEDPNLPNQAPIELILKKPTDPNMITLYSIYKFKRFSKLQKYAEKKFTRQQESYTLAEILTEFRELITEERMFDPLNPSVLFFSKDLETALDVKALHVSEVRKIILKHLIRVEERSNPGPNGVIFPPPTGIYARKLAAQVAAAKAAEATAAKAAEATAAKTAEATTAASTAAVDPTTTTTAAATSTSPGSSSTSNQTPVQSNSSSSLSQTNKDGGSTSRDATAQTSSNGVTGDEISQNVFADSQSRFKLRDPFRDVLSALPEFDKRRELFSYDEITTLLSKYIRTKKDQLFDPRNILVALVQNDPLGKAFGVNSFHRTQVTRLMRQQLIYVDPKASSESKAGEKADENITPHPFPALMKANSMPVGSPDAVVAPRKRSASGDDTTTAAKRAKSDVESEEDEDEEAEDEEDDEEEEEEDEEAYDVEYEIESGDNENRPPQAGGGGGSSSDDSDVECKIIAEVERKDEDRDNWADSEDEVAVQDLDIANPAKEDKMECIRCGGLRKARVKYCSGCWEARNLWIADRPRHKKTKKARNKKLAASRMSGDETDGSGEKHDSGVSSQDLPSQELTDYSDRSGEAELGAEGRVEKVALSLEKAINIGLTKNAESREPVSVGEGSKLAMPVNLNAAAATAQSSQGGKSVVTNLCMFCCSRQKNASLIHGKLGHQVSCYPCAKKLWKEQARCPVCRRKIEKIVKIIMG